MSVLCEKEKSCRTLFTFDFDHTLVDDNTDTWIMSISPELRLKEQFPNEHSIYNIRHSRKNFDCWTDFMDHTFSLISQIGHTREDVLKHMGQLRLYDQALKAVQYVHKHDNADSIILSDSNTVFIEHILQECGSRHIFNDVITNPAHFEPNGRLRVQRFHGHSCDRCTHQPNFCKGTVLREYMERHSYDKVVYVGDGKGDYCPSVDLRKQDVVICREGYALAKLLTTGPTKTTHATVHVIDFVQSMGDFILSNCL